MRRLAVLACALAFLACDGLTEPDGMEGMYALTSIAGHALPAPSPFDTTVVIEAEVVSFDPNGACFISTIRRLKSETETRDRFAHCVYEVRGSTVEVINALQPVGFTAIRHGDELRRTEPAGVEWVYVKQ
jgi:hypothetical protein